MSPIQRVATAVLAAGSLTLGAAACRASDVTTAPPTTVAPGSTVSAATGTTINVTLTEWDLKPSASTAPAGKITFTAKNDGTAVHELVLFKTDLAIDELPLDEEGAVDERAAGIELIDEVEDVKAGTTKTFVTDLKPGAYVLVCNLVDKGVNHFGQKMYSTFKVT